MHFQFSDPPVLTGHPQTKQTADMAGRMQLSCVASSIEIADIVWYKNGTMIVNGDGVHVINEIINVALSQKTSTLTVNPVTASTIGNYTCNATSSLGSAVDDTIIEIFCK